MLYLKICKVLCEMGSLMKHTSRASFKVFPIKNVCSYNCRCMIVWKGTQVQHHLCAEWA